MASCRLLDMHVFLVPYLEPPILPVQHSSPKTDERVCYVVLLNELGISCHNVVHEVSPKVGI